MTLHALKKFKQLIFMGHTAQRELLLLGVCWGRACVGRGSSSFSFSSSSISIPGTRNNRQKCRRKEEGNGGGKTNKQHMNQTTRHTGGLFPGRRLLTDVNNVHEIAYCF